MMETPANAITPEASLCILVKTACFGYLLLLQVGEAEQMVVSRALFGIAKDFVGADDLPESQRRVGIVGSEVGVGALDGLPECRPETFGIIMRKGPE